MRKEYGNTGKKEDENTGKRGSGKAGNVDGRAGKDDGKTK